MEKELSWGWRAGEMLQEAWADQYNENTCIKYSKELLKILFFFKKNPHNCESQQYIWVMLYPIDKETELSNESIKADKLIFNSMKTYSFTQVISL